MIKINQNFQLLSDSYLFSKVAQTLREYKDKNPGADIIRMDIGDVTLPLPATVRDAMHSAVDEMGDASTFRGYGPEQGYLFLRDAISEHDYKSRGIDISPDEIFISDGAKSDLGNLSDIYAPDCMIATIDPGYPVFTDTNVMAGRAGVETNGRWSNIEYLDCKAENNFLPPLPNRHADVIYLCSPCNPTGTVMTRNSLAEFVDYAHKNSSLIIFDSAYEAYVTDPSLPGSIYEIEGAKEVAIEVRSYSKTAGFTGMRCGYTVVPEQLMGKGANGLPVSLRQMWNRRQSTKFNGASYIIQRGAAALYTPEGKRAVRENVDYYLANARLIRDTLLNLGYETYGGENSPYIWIKSDKGEDSWTFFRRMLHQCRISSTPGVGFGLNGEGYIRLTGFNSSSNTREGLRRIAEMKINNE